MKGWINYAWTENEWINDEWKEKGWINDKWKENEWKEKWMKGKMNEQMIINGWKDN